MDQGSVDLTDLSSVRALLVRIVVVGHGYIFHAATRSRMRAVRSADGGYFHVLVRVVVGKTSIGTVIRCGSAHGKERRRDCLATSLNNDLACLESLRVAILFCFSLVLAFFLSLSSESCARADEREARSLAKWMSNDNDTNISRLDFSFSG